MVGIPDRTPLSTLIAEDIARLLSEPTFDSTSMSSNRNASRNMSNPRGNRDTRRRGGRGSRSEASACRAAPQYTLATLVEELSQRAGAGETQETLIEWLYSLTAGLGIRMRYDEHKTADPPAPEPESPKVEAKEAFPALVSPSSPQPAAEAAATSEDSFQKAGRRKKKEVIRIPITVEKGRMVLHFGDPALQERDPPAGGRFDHLADGESFVGRIILSCDRRNIRIDAPLCAEANGAVIDARTWKHLVVPSRAFTPRPSAKEVDRGLAAADESPEGDRLGTGVYDVIQVGDGTVVNLYCWDHPTKGPIWCLSSSNGYDVSHLKWMGAKTYAEIVHELFLASDPGFAAATGMTLERDYLCEGDMRLAFASLDRSRSYTIGFRHGNFHPMRADSPGIWNIQTADLATGAPEYGPASPGLPLIPRQALYGREDIIRLAKAGGRHGVGADGMPIQMADLDHISRTALEDAKAVITGKAPTVPPLPPAAGVHVCPFNYGFILRSRSPEVTGGYSDILCESPLLRRVRQLVYQRPSRQVRDNLDETSRLEYNALKSFLTMTDRDDFLALFPEFAPRFAVYQEFVDNVIHLVLHMHRQNAMAPTTRSAEDSQPKTQTKTVARAMLTHILRHEKDFKAFHADARSIVHDFVVCPEYTVLYLRAIGLPATADE